MCWPVNYPPLVKRTLLKAAAVCAAILISIAVFCAGMALAAWIAGSNTSLEGNLLNLLMVLVASLAGVATYKRFKRMLPPPN